MIDQFLQSGDEERLAALDHLENGPKVKFAVNASFLVNFFLFIIQMYAAISTGSLSLFATAADAFMDLVSSCVMRKIRALLRILSTNNTQLSHLDWLRGQASTSILLEGPALKQSVSSCFVV